MFKPRPCGCKGIRTCLICEADFGIQKVTCSIESEDSLKDSLEFCHLCGDKAWPGQDVWKRHPNHHPPNIETDKQSVYEQGYEYLGVLLVPDFLTEKEETELVSGCDSMEWDLSQSGRRKQNFGPKTNFKRKKISGKSFEGFPSFSNKFQQKLRTVPLLSDFITIEQCAIEYRPETGACIDPHIDDCWVWGERVISISLLSPSYLTMTKYTGTAQKYNLDYHFCNNGEMEVPSKTLLRESAPSFPIVRIPMPTRSLLVLYGPARYAWEHCVLRKDISSRRICMAYREFTPEYLPAGSQYESQGEDVIKRAEQFF